jgi:glycosyltransferase involved in cell wall biosynthesis
MALCDLHVHSIHSTDSGNFALRRARLGESYTLPALVYERCVRRGMTLVTISDHNTLDGALRIVDRPNTFLSVEVTTRFPEDDVVLHVLVWNLTEEDHRDLQPYRPSVYELAAFLRERRLAHALAHPLYRMGPPLTVSHVERMMLLFGLWEGRNGARPESSNLLACRLAAAVTPAYLDKLAERHGFAPCHAGRIGLTGGSDDHGGLDMGTTWTEAPGSAAELFLASVAAGEGSPRGEHGSTAKLAHAVGALALNAYRRDGRRLPDGLEQHVGPLFDEPSDGGDRHEAIITATNGAARVLASRARAGGIALDSLPTLGGRIASLALAAALESPYVASLRHHANTRADVDELEAGFFGIEPDARQPRALVFTDTFTETNGVAGTMRRLAAATGGGELEATVVTALPRPTSAPGLISFLPEWGLPLPGYEAIELRFPSLTEVLARVEREEPDVVHLATPGPVGVCGLVAARLLGIPVVGSYHTELAPYALHLTRDAVVADAVAVYVDWFYRQCSLVLAPTRAVSAQLGARGFEGRVRLWGRGVDAELFAPHRGSSALRARLLGDGDVLLLFVGRLSEEKGLDVLFEAMRTLQDESPGPRLAIAGEGMARRKLEAAAPSGVTFLGEVHGPRLAELYASADVFCFPSTTDTFGQVVLEAAAAGLPAIVSAAGGGAELVVHGETGLIASSGARSLADAILALAAAPDARRRLGAAARVTALERTWERSFDELRHAYAEAASNRPALSRPSVAA